MANLLHVCLYNEEAEASDTLLSQIGALNFVRIVAEVGDPETLATSLQGGGINLVFFHLDPDPARVQEVIEQVATKFPGLALIAISHDTSPEAILAPMRAGCDQFVCEPMDHNDLSTAVARAASKRALGGVASRCVCVTSASGGVGTTSLAANLALEIGSITQRACALVDMDFQFGDLAMNFDCAPRFTFYDLATSGADLDRAVLESSLAPLPCNVSLLARPEKIQHAATLNADMVHRVIEVLLDNYENVVIDLPGGVEPRSIAAMAQADYVLLVCQLIVPNIRNTKRYLDAIVQEGIADERIHVVVNRCQPTPGRVTTKDLEDAVKRPPFATIPSDYHFVAQSIDFGQPIATDDTKNAVRTAIRDMAIRIIDDGGSAAPDQVEKKGLLGRLLSK